MAYCTKITHIMYKTEYVFRVVWQEVHDGGFGGLNDDNSWTGMIGEVHRGVSLHTIHNMPSSI